MTQTAPPKGEFSKVELKMARLVFERHPLPDGVKALLEGQPTSLDFFKSIVAKAKHLEAIKFLAVALPKKDAVAWACHCATLAGGKDGGALPSPQNAAIQAGMKWVLAQTDETRRAAFTAAETAGFGTPGGCAALAAFLSGGSLAPATQAQGVPPPENACADAAGGAVIMAGVFSKPEKAPEKYARYLEDGLAIASGRLPKTEKLQL